jgi:hypothetical protein
MVDAFFDLPPQLANYPGSKGAMGVAKQIVSRFPTHDVYIDAFAGASAVFRLKRPSRLSILLDLDSAVIHAWLQLASPPTSMPDPYDFQTIFSSPGTIALTVDARSWLPRASLFLATKHLAALVYADPPYLLSTRTKRIYRHELASDEEHSSLLATLTALHLPIALSGYPSELYGRTLSSWRCVTFPASTRGGIRTESLWMNYPEPRILHDPRFIGATFRDREKLKRQRSRWASRFAAMPPAHRQTIASALASVDPASLAAAMLKEKNSKFSGQTSSASPII